MRRKSETYIPCKPCKHGHFKRYIKTKRCVECRILYNIENEKDIKDSHKAYYQKNKEHLLPKQNSWRVENPERVMLLSAKARAKLKGLEFNLVESDIVIPKYCPVFPEIELIRTKGRWSNNSPSLDRVDNSKGYVKGNIRVISNQANMLKSNGTIELFKRLIVYIESSSQEKN